MCYSHCNGKMFFWLFYVVCFEKATYFLRECIYMHTYVQFKLLKRCLFISFLLFFYTLFLFDASKTLQIYLLTFLYSLFALLTLFFLCLIFYFTWLIVIGLFSWKNKVKAEVEGIERTKDDDLQRFRNQKIYFSFEIINSIPNCRNCCPDDIATDVERI